ncbi:MAG: GntR family transcriptional regulator [Pseudomonadota bacterium]
MTGGNEDDVYGALRDAIFEQRLAPGTRLREEALATIFSVSRAVVRRALARLSYDKLVDMRRHRGAVVAHLTVEEARAVFAARRLVEQALIALCAAKVRGKDIAALRRLTAREANCARRGERARWIRLSGEFHLALARLAGNAPLADFLGHLVARTSLSIALYGNAGGQACVGADHARIVDALAQGDTATASALMLAHLERCEAALRFSAPPASSDLDAVFARQRADRAPYSAA